MAHGKEKRTQLRGLYVFQRMAMEAACKKLGVPRSTGNRWKQEATEQGDDWETARAAVAMGDENFKNLSAKLLEDYLIQHQATMDLLREAKDMGPRDRAETLASMSDSFNKTMSSFKRLNPELNRQAVQLDILQRFAAFAQQRYPQHLAALVEMLEPFGEELAKVK
ncbi:DUF1804 family protein [Comamonas testosteroni]|uniref:DUF1804 family protein n=1 Tax=Comamonas testosteroni TaxID=285 RepID=UPI0015FB76A9|nr:DUF1804 family protein [Comamonas testosteroni]